jgi:hypothetical protein
MRKLSAGIAVMIVPNVIAIAPGKIPLPHESRCGCHAR